MNPLLCAGSGWGMYPSLAHNDSIQCPACGVHVPVGWTLVADRKVRVIGEHPCPG